MSTSEAIKHYDFELDNANCGQLIAKMALDLKPHWAARGDEIRTVDFSGGITNRIVACYLEPKGVNTCDTMLFRIYGKNTEKFICREEEMNNMKLCKRHHIGPDVYCKYNNGVCYEYLPGHVVDQKMMLDEKVFTKIAQGVAKLHSINFDRTLTGGQVTVQKPFIFAKIRELLDLVQSDYAQTMPHMTPELLGQVPSKKALEQEIALLEYHISEHVKASNSSYLTFSHNDLLLGNIVYDREADAINFIDFEYSGLNYQSYDLANHFNEFAGVDKPDYSLFPSKDYQLKWIRIYLDAFFQHAAGLGDRQVTDELVDAYYREVSKFTLASHMMWAVWSLVQAQCSQLDFNFVEYAKIRFDQYFKHKAEFVAL